MNNFRPAEETLLYLDGEKFDDLFLTKVEDHLRLTINDKTSQTSSIDLDKDNIKLLFDIILDYLLSTTTSDAEWGTIKETDETKLTISNTGNNLILGITSILWFEEVTVIVEINRVELKEILDVIIALLLKI